MLNFGLIIGKEIISCTSYEETMGNPYLKIPERCNECIYSLECKKYKDTYPACLMTYSEEEYNKLPKFSD